MYKDPIILSLNNYIVNILFNTESSTNLSDSDLSELKNKLDPQTYPKDIIESMESLVVEAKIDIFDKNNVLLLSSEII
jgi:hypothetical protein